jgi:hypothetical protein
MSKHKHHIIPRYRCKELGIDPDFDENIVEVDRTDHARIHWGYKCDDLEPLFEYITPAQWIIDLIPRGDNRDVGAAVLTAKGELDGIDTSGENNPLWKGGVSYDKKAYMKAYMKEYRQTPKNKAYVKEYDRSSKRKEYEKKRRQTPEYKAYMKEYEKKRNITEVMKAYKAEWYQNNKKKKSETQGEGTLKAFLKECEYD